MTFQEQQDLLLKNYLFRYDKDENSVEFIITSICNQKCEYCYLYRYGNEMYPPEANKKENILRNLALLLDWLDENDYQYTTFDIFSGEFFQIPYWEEILNVFYEHQMNTPNIPRRDFVIPTNMSFLMDDEKTARVEYWMNRVRNDVKHFNGFWLSASVDGPTELESVERGLRNGQTKQDEFYDKFFKFIAKYSLSCHPMITREFVKNYKRNYDWWIDNIIKYNVIFKKENGCEVYSIPMMLEVRNAEQWDEESLKDYRDFLFYVAEKDLNTLHNGDLTDFAYHMADNFSDGMMNIGRYNHVQPYTLALPEIQHKLPCSIQGGSIFRVGDLAVVPCHRTCYPDKVYGFLELNEDKTKIIGVHGENPMLAYKIKTLNQNRSFMKCAGCPIKSFCMKGCLGAQYEDRKELFCAIDEVCEMFKTKYRTVNDIAEKYGVYDIILNDLKIPKERREFIKYARDIINRYLYD